jgi:hypothetical protein
MPATVARNYRVASGTASVAGATRVYTVPIGYVLILRYFAVTSLSQSTMTGFARIYTPQGPAEIRLRSWSLALNQTIEWMGQVVLNAGDSIYVDIDVPSLYYWASGALLSGFTSVPVGPVALPAET